MAQAKTMTPITKSEAIALGLKPFTKRFSKNEEADLEKLWKEVLTYQPAAMQVVGEHGSIQIWIPKPKPTPNPTSPKSMRGKFPTVRAIVGQAI